MRIYPLVALAGLLALTGTANAASVFNNNFDAENGGVTLFNYTGFSNLTVTAGSVDLVAAFDFGIQCVGGFGACVDLDGSTLASGTLETGFYAFNAGDTVSFSLDLSGNQRQFNSDDFALGFNFGALTAVTSYSQFGAWGNFTIFNNIQLSGVSTSSSIFGTTPYQNYGIRFVAAQAGTVSATLRAFGDDNFGPLADNLNLDITANVPEPASWAMMISGFALVGVAARRRRKVLVA